MAKALFIFFILASGFTLSACRRSVTEEFVTIDEPLIALTHLRVIDGTGSPPSEEQTILIEAGRIKAIGNAANIQVPANAKVLDLSGHTAIPGLLGMRIEQGAAPGPKIHLSSPYINPGAGQPLELQRINQLWY